ncbi:MAG: hypothetical protein HYV93_22755 [Candidatus Rokubacteria bacterium]|nr:hypothetical protein [Candidatus Rokubacteria bacterium]
MKRLLASLALLENLACASAVAAQTAQIGPGAPDPIEHSRALSLRPRPALPPAPPPAERVVPERRVRVPETGQEVVIPAHTERRISATQVWVPPLAGFPAGDGAAVVHFPAGERLPAELRQGP